MSNIEKSLESKSQSISDWWNCVPSLDKLGVSGTLLVRLSDAVNEVKKIKKDEYAKLLKDLEFDGFDSVSYEYGLKKGKEETEVRVREETAREKNDLMKEFLLDQYGEECKDYEKGCPVCDAWDFYKKRFLVKSKVQKE